MSDTDATHDGGTDDLETVDASPTKAFFVDIITKDIRLDKAIEDLVDNCVDGAKRLRPGISENYEGLWIRIIVSGDRLSISDNCGGIPLDIARKYAFKFGRPKGFAATPFSVGQFGIGMKRALFKMGTAFVVRSVEPNSKFSVPVDVIAWANDEKNWDFRIEGLEHVQSDVSATGTEIKVAPLMPSVATVFGAPWFHSQLRNQIRTTQQHFIRLGLQIFFNDELIIGSQWQLKSDQGIEPSFKRYEDDFGGGAVLKMRIYAGIGNSSKAHAGWYVFCNGRCILEADQTARTGWDVTIDDVSNPKYHGQFARFRGYAYLDSEDARLLPWNTTKTDLNEDSDAYRRLKSRLVEAMRPVIDFLNSLDAENDLEPQDQVLSKAVSEAPLVPIENLKEKAVFQYTAPTKRGPPLATISSYKRPSANVDKLKEAFGASSNRAVGERSFDYAFDNLIEKE